MKPIEPKPKTVVELFEGHPERWIKSRWYNDDYTCFCLVGALDFIYPDTESKSVYDRIVKTLPTTSISSWNDAPERTFEEVLEKCKELGI